MAAPRPRPSAPRAMACGAAPQRLPLADYVRELWARRHFIVAFASARNIAVYTNARLGQVWQVLTPAAQRRGLLPGLRADHQDPRRDPQLHRVPRHRHLHLHLHATLGARRFQGDQRQPRPDPRAALPAGHRCRSPTRSSSCSSWPISMVVMLAIVLATGEPVTVAWLLIAARAAAADVVQHRRRRCSSRALGARITDVTQLLPFILRTWLYVSGVFYSIAYFTEGRPQCRPGDPRGQPRRGLHRADPRRPAAGARRPPATSGSTPWSGPSSAFVGGFLYFYRAEETYGRG